MNHGRTIWLAALAALLVLGSSACGDDDGGGKDSGTDHGGGAGKDPGSSGKGGGDKDASSSSGGSGSDKDSGTGNGGSGGDELVDAGSSDGGGIEQCGAESCGTPMCCADAFQSLCGLKVNARACLPPQPTDATSDDRCPSVSIMNGAFMIPSCCTDDGKCGINAQAAGMGCISLEEVIAYTSGMGMARDGGTPPPMGMGMGFGIMWPEPKACN